MSSSELIKELQQQGIYHPVLLEALKKIPREKFVLKAYQQRAYENSALAIECEQTISQPYIVALMTQTLLTHPAPHKILEIGTGSGYQTAILAYLFEQVWTVERIKTLYLKAQQTLKPFFFTNLSFKWGDGAQGWQEAAPFDGIIVTAATPKPPLALIEQLAEEGIMVIPLGSDQMQHLTVIKKQKGQLATTVLEPVRFVPLIAEN